MLQALSQHSSELLDAGDSASAMKVKVQERELACRVSKIQQLIISYESNFGHSDTQSQLSEFLQTVREDEYTCNQAETVLQETMLTDGVDDVMLTTLAARLDRSLSQLVGEQFPVEATTRLSYIPRLSTSQTEALQQLSDHSHALQSSTKDRSRDIRQKLLIRSDGVRKCKEWLQFVTQIETEVNTLLAGNFDTLLTQRKALEASFNQFLFKHVYFTIPDSSIVGCVVTEFITKLVSF